MTPQHFSDAVLAALGGLVRRGAFALSGELPASVVVERPQLAGQGDYSTNAALQLAGRAGLSSRELAELLAQELRPVAGVASASTAGPGFVNVTVTWAALQAVAEQVVDAGSAYGAVDVGLGTLLADPATRLVDRVGVDDPLHAVRYAHSRLASLLRNATDLGVGTGAAGPALLDHPCERELLLVVAEYPTVVAIAARLREPHRVARHLEDTVAAFHRFSDSCRVLPQGDEDPTELHRARLLLVDATRTVVANGLHLLGATAPARM